jgi:hypothetical protein
MEHRNLTFVDDDQTLDLEKLVVWTLLDTGLCVSALANLKKDNID